MNTHNRAALEKQKSIRIDKVLLDSCSPFFRNHIFTMPFSFPLEILYFRFEILLSPCICIPSTRHCETKLCSYLSKRIFRLYKCDPSRTPIATSIISILRCNILQYNLPFHFPASVREDPLRYFHCIPQNLPALYLHGFRDKNRLPTAFDPQKLPNTLFP